jgi:hypothetical protein
VRPVIPVLRRLRQDFKFKVSLGFMVSSSPQSGLQIETVSKKKKSISLHCIMTYVEAEKVAQQGTGQQLTWKQIVDHL